jgi:zinc protease
MKSHLLAACAAVAALALSGSAAAQDAPGSALVAPPIEYTRWQIANGLTVIAVPDQTTATITTSMWYDVGSKLDPEGRSGFAHLFEHILSRKTVNMPYNMINGLTADIGGTRNASNGTDRTNYFETVPAEYLETMLWTHRERMAFPVVDTEVFETERGVVKEELRTRVLAPPYGIFGRIVLPEVVFDTLPQRRPGIGSIEDLDSAVLDDARAFHQAYYGPDTATLIVAGNFQIDDLRALVDSYFADIPRRANPVDVLVHEREAPRTAPRDVAAYAPNVPLPLAGTVWAVPEAADPDMAVLEVLAAIMDGGENSRFNTALIRSGKAVDVQMIVDFSQEAGMFGHFAIISPTGDLAEVQGLLDAEMARLRTEEVSAAELAEAQNELISAALSGRETARGRAFELGEYLVMTGDIEAADRRLAQIAAVTPADVSRVARDLLAPQARVGLTYGRGPHNPADYANPVPMPAFRTLPPAVGQPRAVLPEDQRQAPPPPADRPDVQAPQLARHVLGNGMQVVAAQTGAVPVATLSILLPGGSASDPREQAGRANLAAALANRGTMSDSGSQSATEIAARLESLGASMSTATRSDGTVFSLSAPAANLAAAGAVLADVIRHPAYPADEVARELARTIEGRRSAYSDPAELAAMALRPALYGDAAYGNVNGGTPASLALLTHADLAAHAATWWHPAAAQAVVTGGIAPDEAFALVESLFGDWSAAAMPPAAPADPAGDRLPPRTVVIDLPDAGQAAVYLVGRGPQRSDAAWYPLDLANAVLGGGSNGRLFEEVRNRRSLSYGAYSQIGAQRFDPLVSANAQTANETVDEVVAVMLAEYARLGSEPFSEDLLARRRLFLAGGRSRALESSAGYATIMLDMLALGIDPAEAAAYAQRLDGVSGAAASAAARQYFAPDQTTLVIVGNAAAFVDDLRVLRPDVEVIPVGELDLGRAALR